jgi:hypothetical protein
VHPESKRPLGYLLSCDMPFQALDGNQLEKDITEFRQSAAGAVLTQIARYSPVLNQSTRLSNKGFTCALTHRITGSYRLLFGAGREMEKRYAHASKRTENPVAAAPTDICTSFDARHMDCTSIHTTAWMTLYTRDTKMLYVPG